MFKQDYFPDLTPYQYRLEFKLPEVLNVGWIHPDQQFDRGECEKEFNNKLASLITEFQPGQVLINRMRAGFQTCEFCNKESWSLEHNGKEASLDWVEIWIKGDGVFYNAPGFIYHYILDHGYAPPKEFQDAVLKYKPNKNTNGQSEFNNIKVRNYEIYKAQH